VIEIALGAAATYEGVHAAFRTDDAAALRASSDDVSRRVGLSIGADPPGPIFVVPAMHYFVDDHEPVDHGTSHGTPWAYDREVPVLFDGPGVTRAVGAEIGDARAVAPTIARLLGVAPPAQATLPPLVGAPRE
jgi:hypothetical protein